MADKEKGCVITNLGVQVKRHLQQRNNYILARERYLLIRPHDGMVEERVEGE